VSTKTSTTQNSKYSPWYLAFLVGAVLFLGYINSGIYKDWISKSKGPQNQSALLEQQNTILNQDDVINTNWLRTLNPLVKNVEGRIVWSNILQKGIMEFVGLPEIAKNQKYQLWIYDLAGKDTKPVFSDEFSEVSEEALLIPFSAKKIITAPFKFELLLKTEGKEVSEPLFLAQP